MADYFPLISRAVTGLEPNTVQRRQAIYDRAREALERQLRGLDPPISESDLLRERITLEDAIRRVEAQFVPEIPTAAGTMLEPLPSGEDDTSVRDSGQPRRPKVSTVKGPLGFLRSRNAIGAMAGVIVCLILGVLAYRWRDDPRQYLPKQEVAQAVETVVAPQRKSEGRLDGTGVTAPVNGPSKLTPPPEAESKAQILPVAGRVLFFEETADDPRGAQSDGNVVWRLDSSLVPDQPAASVIRGSISLSKANMNLEISIKKNRSATLPATHIVEVIFKPENGREGVQQIGPIELREQEAQAGFPLQGAVVPVGVNMFLIGLEATELSREKNLEALRDRRWLAFQFQLTNKKVGAILIEKSQTGDRVFKEGLRAWQ